MIRLLPTPFVQEAWAEGDGGGGRRKHGAVLVKNACEDLSTGGRGGAGGGRGAGRSVFINFFCFFFVCVG